MTGAAKAFMPYFEVLQDCLVKRPCDADLVFCSWVLDVRTRTFEKTERLSQQMFIDKQPITKINKIRKLNYI